MNRKNLIWVLPILLMILLTPFTPWLDLKITRYFYHPDPLALDPFSSGPFFDFLFNYGILPAWIVAIISALIFLFSYVSNPLKAWRNPSLVLILTLIVGAGFLTHMVLKDHWGRPRPKQVIEFGGTQKFRPFYSPNIFHQPQPSKSFPCGHCSMGFFFFALALVGKRLNKKWLEILGFSLAFILGGLLGFARIAQGAHFFSDVLFSALLLWLTALAMDYLVYSNEKA